MFPDNTTMKYCKACEQWKPADRAHFNAGKSCKDGLTTPCKECAKKRSHDWYHANKERGKLARRAWYSANVEKVAEYKREWRQSNLERLTDNAKAWYQANKASVKVRRKRWYNANADYAREYSQEWQRSNPEKARTNHRRYRARKANAEGTHTAEDLQAIRAAQTDKRGRLICWKCGKPIRDTPHLDHWIPLTKGGRNDAGNLHYMHATCNTSKSAKLPHEIGRLL